MAEKFRSKHISDKCYNVANVADVAVPIIATKKSRRASPTLNVITQMTSFPPFFTSFPAFSVKIRTISHNSCTDWAKSHFIYIQFSDLSYANEKENRFHDAHTISDNTQYTFLAAKLHIYEGEMCLVIFLLPSKVHLH